MTRSRSSFSLVPAVLIVAAAWAGGVSAQTPAWFPAGDALSSDGGAWHYFNQRVETNLVEEGLTYLRVTSGPCDGSPNDYAVYEANLAPPPVGETAWYGTLQPLAGMAQALRQMPGAPNAYIMPRGLQTEITVALDGVPPSTTFSACFRRP
jgi:hypothetical protein